MLEHAAHVAGCAHPTADSQRYEDLIGRLRDHLIGALATLVRGGNVQEDELVGAVLVVGASELHRVAGVADVDEGHALHDASRVHVEAGDDRSLVSTAPAPYPAGAAAADIASASRTWPV